jgi:glycosyltransferase involved in cell wall biosynthesis
MPNTKIKVAYILTPITFGGAEKVSLNFLRLVDRDRFEIHPILFIRPWENLPYFAIQITQLGYYFSTVPVSVRPEGERLRVLRVASQVYSILKNGSFDLVHTHGYFADICSVPMTRILGIPSISTCHGFIRNDHKLKIYNKLDAYALRCCKIVIAVSEALKIELIQAGIKESLIKVIPNAVPSFLSKQNVQQLRQKKRLSLGINSGCFAVGYLGRLSKEKGLTFLIKAISDLKKESTELKLILVGDGPERQILERQVHDCGLYEMVIFAGFQEETESWISSFDLFVLPSLSEGTPLALLEAMAIGVPVLASSVGGVPKVITDEVNGLLVSPGNSRSLGDKILRLKNNPELLSKYARAGLVTVNQNYNIFDWSKKIENSYERILYQKPS